MRKKKEGNGQQQGKAKGKKIKNFKDQILKIRWNMEEITKKKIVEKENLPSEKHINILAIYTTSGLYKKSAIQKM